MIYLCVLCTHTHAFGAQKRMSEPLDPELTGDYKPPVMGAHEQVQVDSHTVLANTSKKIYFWGRRGHSVSSRELDGGLTFLFKYDSDLRAVPVSYMSFQYRNYLSC